MVAPALEAAEELEKEGISLAVVNARFAKPLDAEMILRFARGGAGAAVGVATGSRDSRFGIDSGVRPSPDTGVDATTGAAKRVVITAEEGVVAGGFGSAVRELLDANGCFDVRFLAIGLPIEIYPCGKVEQIKRMYDLDVPGLVKRIRAFYRP